MGLYTTRMPDETVCKTCHKSSKTMHLTWKIRKKHMLESQTFFWQNMQDPIFDVLGKIMIIMVSCKCGHHCYCSWGITDTIGTIRNPKRFGRARLRDPPCRSSWSLLLWNHPTLVICLYIYICIICNEFIFYSPSCALLSIYSKSFGKLMPESFPKLVGLALPLWIITTNFWVIHESQITSIIYVYIYIYTGWWLTYPSEKWWT